MENLVNIVVDASGSMGEDEKNAVVKYLLNGISSAMSAVRPNLAPKSSFLNASKPTLTATPSLLALFSFLGRVKELVKASAITVPWR